MALSTKPYKGARDFYPEDKRLQKYIFEKWRRTAESFGYEEYDAPILEPLEMYLAKSGDEIVKEQTYVFEDRGGRKVVIRPEMTPSVSRMVAAKRQELASPLRWFSIPNLWRYERPQRGRLREHWQLNVDIFGIPGLEAELEIISLADAMFKSFGAQPEMYEIKINSRKLMDYSLTKYIGLSPDDKYAVSKLIDRYHKMDRSDFISAADDAINAIDREAGAVEKLLSLLATANISNLPKEIEEHSSAGELNQLIKSLSSRGISNVNFDPSLIRGFDYYTDIVFEVFDKHPENNRSMLGGGRYDGLIELFGVEPLPIVGFGWGDVTLVNFLENHHLLPRLKPETDLYAVLVGNIADQAQKVIADIRNAGINIAVDLSGKKIGDQLKSAEKKCIDLVLIIGENELKTGTYTLKNLKTGKEQKTKLSNLIKKFGP